jgi:hypothetical protein
MYRTFFFLISFVLTLALVGNQLALAATRTWDNEGGNNRWDTALNWSANKIPVEADVARIVLADAAKCLIDGAVSAKVKNLHVGYSDGTTAFAGDLRMTGGSLTMLQASTVGRAATGRFYMEDGTVSTAGTWDIGEDIGGIGSLIMSGGTISVGPDTSVDPVATRAMRIGGDGAAGNATISGGILNVSGNLSVGANVGADGVTASNGLLDMLGGTINVGTELNSRDFRVGYRDATGTANISGGTINIFGDLVIGGTFIEVIADPFQEIPHPGTGRMTMTGGVVSVADANTLEIGLDGSEGWVDLLGGVIRTGDLMIGAADPLSAGLNITEGTLMLNGDKRENVLHFIGAGLITAYGGASGAECRYDYDVSNPGKTTVTAIPEPGTITLLGLGLFALRRRRIR